MTWSFGDSFDLYATTADMANGYWDSIGGGGGYALVAGRFSGSLAISMASAGHLTATKNSGANDAVHHLIVAYQQTTALSGSVLGFCLELYDGATAQCTIGFRQDGAILLKSGIPSTDSAGSGAVTLATYTGAVTAINTWYAFEFEVVINNTTGSFSVRKNGNTVNDFTATGLNTRNSANNYANKLVFDVYWGAATYLADDLFWQSGAATGNWLGDIRCYTRMPASDQSVTFSKSPSSMFKQANWATPTGTGSEPSNHVYWVPINAPVGGVVASLALQLNSALTGNIKMALYDATGAGAGPGAYMATSAELANPSAGLLAFSMVGSPIVQTGAKYWLAIWANATFSLTTSNNSVGVQAVSLTYAGSFPATAVGFSLWETNGNLASAGMTVTPYNSGLVSEPQEDGLTTYVFDSNPGDADFYGIGSIASTPATVIATTVRAYAQKSDAGVRTAAVQLKSGATVAASPTLTLSTPGWGWAWRTDLTDPNTGAAWTPAAVNNAQIGPKVVA